eukprot:1139743-Pelagomonas_calceolata.AAC.5
MKDAWCIGIWDGEGMVHRMVDAWCIRDLNRSYSKTLTGAYNGLDAPAIEGVTPTPTRTLVITCRACTSACS